VHSISMQMLIFATSPSFLFENSCRLRNIPTPYTTQPGGAQAAARCVLAQEGLYCLFSARAGALALPGESRRLDGGALLMPTYEYVCEKCKHRFEQFQSITAAPLKRCPRCKGHLRRLIQGGAGLIFKGSGFYITDYARSGGKKAASAAGSAPSGKDSTAGKKPSGESAKKSSGGED
jgi:putative FmdB family regulatory protein